MQFELSSIPSGTTKTLTVPPYNDTLVVRDSGQTLLNKALTTPVIPSIYVSGTKDKLHTLPDVASDTFAVLDGAQSFTNKTLTTPVIPSIYQDAGKSKLMTLPDVASDTLCSIAASQTLTNKVLDDTTTTFKYTSGTGTMKLSCENIGDGQNRTLIFPNTTNEILVTKNATAVLTNKTLTDGTNNYLQNEADNSKKVTFDLSNITTSNTRSIQFPDSDCTLLSTSNNGVDLTSVQTLTNKTLTTPLITSIYTDVGKTKLVSIPEENGTTLLTNLSTAVCQNKSFLDNTFEIRDNADEDKILTFQCSTITSPFTRVVSAADSDGEMTLCTATQTLTNKTISLASNTVSNFNYQTSTYVTGANSVTTQDFVLAESTNTSTSIALPQCSGCFGKMFTIHSKNLSTYVTSITAYGGDDIGMFESTSLRLLNNESVQLISNGVTKWHILGCDIERPIINEYGSLVATTDCIIAFDNTTPLITEGIELFSMDVDLRSTISRIKFDIDVSFATSNANNVCVTLWEGSTLKKVWGKYSDGDHIQNFGVSYTYQKTSVSSITYSVRIGMGSAGTIYINRNSTSDIYNSQLSSFCVYTIYI